MPKILFCLVVVLAGISIANPSLARASDNAAIVPDPGAVSVRVLMAARTIVDRFGSTSGSCYSHKTDIETTSGICQVDCSGLVAVALKKVSPDHLAHISKPVRRKRPLAEDFEKTFENATSGTVQGWKGIGLFANARVGDIVAWRLPNHAQGKDTGHVFFIDGPPVQTSSTCWQVPIIDSTKGPHANDSRHAGQSGVGRGTLWIETDASGHPAGYHWKSPKSKYRPVPIAIGRAIKEK